VIVESVLPEGRTRLRFRTDTGLAFTLSGKDAALYGLSEGSEIGQALLERLLQDLRRNCLRRAGSLLAARDYSRARLTEKLTADGYPGPVLEGVLGELEEAGYLDEYRMACDYIRLHLEDRSRQRILQDLRRQGLTEELLLKAMADMTAGADPDRMEEAQIRRLLAARQYDPAACDWKTEQKLMAFLYRKGYSAERIRAVMQESDR
jgi:regulatory protein